MEDQDGAILRRGAAEVEREGMQLGDAGFGAGEVVGILAVDLQQLGQHVAPGIVAGVHGIDALTGGVEAKLGERRPFPFFVDEDLLGLAVIERV